jgi:hypothetical protein
LVLPVGVHLEAVFLDELREVLALVHGALGHAAFPILAQH